MNRLKAWIIAAVVCVLVGGCRDEDAVAPAFIHIEAMELVPTPLQNYTSKAGFCSAEIVSCYVEVFRRGGTSIEMLGLFELPFTAPVLYNGEVEYLVVSPAIKISGIAGTQSYYPFYTRDTIRNLTLTAGDTLRLDTLRVRHRVGLESIQLFEPFEYSPETPNTASLAMDSIVWHPNDPENACSGNGYVSVPVADTVSYVPFSINRDFYVNGATSIVYLELDSRSDVPFEVYMHSRYTAGGAIDQQRVMVVNPSDHWQHIYINLGRTWSWFNYHPDFRISFAALNVAGKGGEIRIDNVKFLSSSALH